MPVNNRINPAKFLPSAGGVFLWGRAIVAFLYLLTVFNPCRAQDKPRPIIYDPYPFEEVFVGNLEPVSTLGRPGLSAYLNANTRHFDRPAFVLAGAFPLNRSGTPRASGWSWGAAAGLHDFNQEASRTYTAGAYFWELMMGRSIVQAKDFPDSGARGYLEVAFRNQRPRYYTEYSNFLTAFNQTVQDQNTALIVRAGASMDAAGEGFVRQKPYSFSPALDFSLHLPVVSQHAVLLSGQLRAPFQCGAAWFHCNPFVRVTHSRSRAPTPLLEEVRTKVLFGSQFLLLVQQKYLFNLQFHWAGYYAPTQKAYLATPFVRVSMTIGF